MKSYSQPVRWGACLFVAISIGLGLTGCGSQPSVAATRPVTAPPASATTAGGSTEKTNAINSAAIPKSLFHSGLQAVRDPFFPGSSRLLAKVQGAEPVRQPLISYLKLVGIRSGTVRPMALINRSSFAPGEEGSVTIVLSNLTGKAEVQKVSLRCLEIRRDSVLVNIAGEEGVKELRLAQGK